MPSFFMRLRRVLGFIPRIVAAPRAPSTTPLVLFSTLMMCRRWTSSSDSGSMAVNDLSASGRRLGSHHYVVQDRAFEFEHRPLRQDGRALDDVLQLAHVAGPAVAGHVAPCCAR